MTPSGDYADGGPWFPAQPLTVILIVAFALALFAFGFLFGVRWESGGHAIR